MTPPIDAPPATPPAPATVTMLLPLFAVTATDCSALAASMAASLLMSASPIYAAVSDVTTLTTTDPPAATPAAPLPVMPVLNTSSRVVAPTVTVLPASTLAPPATKASAESCSSTTPTVPATPAKAPTAPAPAETTASVLSAAVTVTLSPALTCAPLPMKAMVFLSGGGTLPFRSPATP